MSSMEITNINHAVLRAGIDDNGYKNSMKHETTTAQLARNKNAERA